MLEASETGVLGDKGTECMHFTCLLSPLLMVGGTGGLDVFRRQFLVVTRIGCLGAGQCMDCIVVIFNLFGVDWCRAIMKVEKT
jgi:hypothetical protein